MGSIGHFVTENPHSLGFPQPKAYMLRLTEDLLNVLLSRLRIDLCLSRGGRRAVVSEGDGLRGYTFLTLPAIGALRTCDGFEAWCPGLHVIVSREPAGGLRLKEKQALADVLTKEA